MQAAHTKTILFLNSLGCGGGAAQTAERVLAAIPGVTHVYVNRLTETAYVEHDPEMCRVEQLQAHLKRAGFVTQWSPP